MTKNFNEEFKYELIVDRISDLHHKVSESNPAWLRDGFCVECSNPEEGVYIMYPCETQKIIRGLNDL